MTQTTTERLTQFLPQHLQRRVAPVIDAVGVLREVQNPAAVASMLPSMFRGAVLRAGRSGKPVDIVSGHPAHFDFTYASTFPEMRELYTRAKQNQWDSDVMLDWSTDVDPLNPEVPILPEGFMVERDKFPIKLTDKEWAELGHSMASWMLSQFLHGEQGALFASAQVTESVQWMDGKLYGATQVVDEGRHVEVFHRYIDEKLNKLYVINDNLFTIIDALISDSRWDMKFLGMQIMVEGLALGAFGMLYKVTSEPLLKDLLKYVIQDEARHVHYGVLALQRHIATLSERERREREDWAFEVALLMRNRFLAHEVYEEWFEGRMARSEWDRFVLASPGLREFRQVMFSRLIPNLRAIGLLSDRVKARYQAAGLMTFYDGRDATRLSGDDLIRDLDNNPGFAAE